MKTGPVRTGQTAKAGACRDGGDGDNWCPTGSGESTGALLPVRKGGPQVGLLEILETSALSKLGKHNPCALGLLLGALPG